MIAYIKSASCISPQQTFGAESLFSEAMKFDSTKITAIEPDYKTYLNIPSARRMSRLIKMGVCAALNCLKQGNVSVPDAIIAGTGLGCMEDSEKFLASLLTNNEQTLSPTSFIFSTHNTVAAQVALLLQCNNYNFTHTHRGLSFENTLMDSMLFLEDHPDANVLAGSSDEVTDTSHKILQRLGDVQSDGTGAKAGEGSVFFLLNKASQNGDLARIIALQTFSRPSGEDDIVSRINQFREKYRIGSGDMILFGKNGDDRSDKIYRQVKSEIFPENPEGNYKQLCGEYHTSTAFATWLSACMLKEGSVPSYVSSDGKAFRTPERILIFNHYKGREFSLILLERC